LHRVDAPEVWHWYGGAPLALSVRISEKTHLLRLGSDLCAGERPQYLVPARVWQSAESLGDWTLAGCTEAPGFEFSGFEMAPENWRPGADFDPFKSTSSPISVLHPIPRDRGR